MGFLDLLANAAPPPKETNLNKTENIMKDLRNGFAELPRALRMPSRFWTHFIRHENDGEIHKRPNARRQLALSVVDDMHREFLRLPLRQYANESSRNNIVAHQP